jgi:hypothetical protein
MEYLPLFNIVLIYGGRNRSRILSSISVLYLKTLTWLSVDPKGYIPQPMFNHCSAMVGNFRQ